MKIIYHCNVSNLLTLFTAYLHINFDENITFSDLENSFLNNLTKLDHPPGNLIFIGIDKNHNKIFILKPEKQEKIVCQTIMGFTKILNLKEKYTFISLNQHENIYLKISRLIQNIPFLNLSVKRIYLLGIWKEFASLKKRIKHFFDKVN